MKNIIVKTIGLIAATGLISFGAMAQKSALVPESVQSAFSAKYPQVQLKAWKVKKDTCIATFIQDSKKYQAYYNMGGTWLNTQRRIRHTSTLPVEAMNYLKTSSYASWHVDDMTMFRAPGQTQYRVYVDNHSGNPSAYENAGSASDTMLCFDTTGKLVKVVSL